jgi:hypothetical protein
VFPEAVQIKSGKTIYGALDCTGDWTYSAAKKSEIRPDAGRAERRSSSVVAAFRTPATRPTRTTTRRAPVVPA